MRKSNPGIGIAKKTAGMNSMARLLALSAMAIWGNHLPGNCADFDVKVLCYDILPNVGDVNAKQVSLDELQQQADVLSLHIPWTTETDKMVNSDFINSFAKPFWLINTSRGKNVVTADLALALQSGKILGAGLDVLEYEKDSFEHLFTDGNIPEAFQYLLHSENVILSPHIAGWTMESKVRLAQVIVDKIKAMYIGESQEVPALKRVTGIGGFFFRAKDPKALTAWYNKHLGLKTDDYGCTFWWKDAEGNDCSTQWSAFKEDTTYMEPSQKQFMQNFRVDNLDALIERLKAEDVELVGEPQSFDYGKFGWIIDPEGNKIELWEPKDSAFL